MEVNDAAQESKLSELAKALVENASPAERDAIEKWAMRLLDIRNSDRSSFAKAKEAISVTAYSRVVWPIVRSAAGRLKEFGWDKSTGHTRVLMVVGGAAVAVFGMQGAGIAALGSAIGLPLFVVLGGGAVLASVLVEEVRKRRGDGN